MDNKAGTHPHVIGQDGQSAALGLQQHEGEALGTGGHGEDGGSAHLLFHLLAVFAPGKDDIVFRPQLLYLVGQGGAVLSLTQYFQLPVRGLGMYAGKLLYQQVETLDLREPPGGQHRLLPWPQLRVLGIMLQEIRDIYQPGVTVFPRHHLLRLFHQLWREQGHDVYALIALFKAPHIFFLEAVVVVQLADFQRPVAAVAGQEQVVLVAGGDYHAILNVLYHLCHGAALAQKYPHAPDALPDESQGPEFSECGLPLFPVGGVSQQVEDPHPLRHREGRGIRHVVYAEELHLIARSEEIGHADNGLLHPAHAQMQGDDVHRLFLFFRDRLHVLLSQGLDAVYYLCVVLAQVVSLFGHAPGLCQGFQHILPALQAPAVLLQVLGAVEGQAQGLGLHDVERLALVAGGGDEGVHPVHVLEGVGLLAQESDLVGQAQAVPLIFQGKAFVPVPYDVKVQVVPVSPRPGKQVQHDVVALLVAEPAQSHEIQLVRVRAEIEVLPGLLIYLPGVDGVLYHRELIRVIDAAADHEGLYNALGDTHEPVVIFELVLEVEPEHPVLPFVFQLHADIVVYPHHPPLGRDAEGPQGAGELVGIEVYGQVVFRAVPKIQAHHIPGNVKGNERAEPGQVLQVLYIQLWREIHFPEGLSVRQVQVHLKMLVVEVPQQVHQRLLYSPHVQIILKEGYPLH